MAWGNTWGGLMDPMWGEPKSKNLRELPSLNSVENLNKIYNNFQPTHDPYTNPNAHIYYECKCGAILDPKTKSFAALNNYASEKGWKIRFGEHGYTPYCVKCGEGVE